MFEIMPLDVPGDVVKYICSNSNIHGEEIWLELEKHQNMSQHKWAHMLKP